MYKWSSCIQQVVRQMPRYCSAFNCTRKNTPENRSKGFSFHVYVVAIIAIATPAQLSWPDVRLFACHDPPPPLAWYSTRRSTDYSARQDKDKALGTCSTATIRKQDGGALASSPSGRGYFQLKIEFSGYFTNGRGWVGLSEAHKRNTKAFYFGWCARKTF